MDGTDLPFLIFSEKMPMKSENTTAKRQEAQRRAKINEALPNGSCVIIQMPCAAIGKVFSNYFTRQMQKPAVPDNVMLWFGGKPIWGIWQGSNTGCRLRGGHFQRMGTLFNAPDDVQIQTPPRDNHASRIELRGLDHN